MELKWAKCSYIQVGIIHCVLIIGSSKNITFSSSFLRVSTSWTDTMQLTSAVQETRTDSYMSLYFQLPSKAIETKAQKNAYTTPLSVNFPQFDLKNIPLLNLTKQVQPRYLYESEVSHSKIRVRAILTSKGHLVLPSQLLQTECCQIVMW